MNDAPHIRWMISKDLLAVLEIEALGFEHPWGQDEFLRVLRERSCIGMVADIGPGDSIDIVGYMIYEIQSRQLELLNFAVHPDFRREGVGRQLIERLISKIDTPYHRNRRTIETYVRESNLPALAFFRSLGFRSAGIVPGYYDLTTDDAFRLRYQEQWTITDDDLDQLFNGV